MEENTLQKAPDGKGRKKKRDPDKWKKNIEKYSRNQPKMLPRMPVCGHSCKAFACKSLTQRDVNHFHHLVFQHPNKVCQDNIILKYCNATAPKRSRAVKTNSSRKGISIVYYVKKATLSPGTPAKVPVCQKTFLGILGNISKTRVLNICKTHYLKGEPIREKRGGDTRSYKYEGKRVAISQFMEKLKPVEKHYCREKSTRVYLPSELSLNRLWHMYNKQCDSNDLKVKKYFFRNYVNKKYNIGFGQPATDACSYCIQIDSLRKSATSEEEKNKCILNKRIHTLRYKAFFSYLKKQNDETLTLSYDCQKNLVLPKVPDQSAYYSRQLYTYNFTVCRGTSKDPLLKDNVYIYNWLENEYSKGGNEIASAVFHQLKIVAISPDVKTVRHFADGCGGQNKNSIMIGMASKWLLCHAPKTVTRVEFYFPVTGHSFLPSDRVFARIEKRIRKKEEIIFPHEYTEIFEEHGTVIKLGDNECPVFDWKTEVNSVQLKPGNWHFQFNPCKRIILQIHRKTNKVKIRGEANYKTDLCKPRAITKTGKNVFDMEPAVITKKNSIKEIKKKDIVLSLLKTIIQSRTVLISLFDWRCDLTISNSPNRKP